MMKAGPSKVVKNYVSKHSNSKAFTFLRRHVGNAGAVVGNGETDMGTFKKYQIVGDDLFLTESMYWAFEPFRPDAIKFGDFQELKEPSLTKRNWTL